MATSCSTRRAIRRVNVGYFDICDPTDSASYATNCTTTCPTAPNPYCPLGNSQLAATGFDTWGQAGATAWLTTQVPVHGGDVFTLRFAIWDNGDQGFDSTVLIDGFEWVLAGSVVLGTSP